ncbi:MAG: glycosyltransferase family 4 protein [Gammaproteobacteria bacterium]
MTPNSVESDHGGDGGHARMPGLSILMVAPQPFFRARGTPFSVLHRIRALLLMGHSVDLVTYPFGEDIEMEGLRIFRCSTPPFVKDVRIGPSLPKIALDVAIYQETVKQLKERSYDIIHSHEEAAFFCTRLARRFGMAHIYDMHSSLPQQLGNFRRFNLKPLRIVFERLENYVLDTCDGVITICQDLADVVEDYVPSKPHKMIENTGDDSKVFSTSTRDLRKDLGLRDEPVALYTGTFEQYQGLDLLLDAFAQVVQRHPAARLLLVGGRPVQVEEMRSKVKGLSLQDNVTLTGTVHPSEIPAFLEAADMIVSPRSRGTNTPLKLYNYMRSGVPLVATNIYSHTQTLDSEIAHLVTPDAAGIAEGIVRLIDDRAYAQSLADSASRRADASYSDKIYIEKVADFYRQIPGLGDATITAETVDLASGAQQENV